MSCMSPAPNPTLHALESPATHLPSVLSDCPVNTGSIQFNFIYKTQFHKSQFASEDLTAYNIPLSLGPSQPIRKNSSKKPTQRWEKKPSHCVWQAGEQSFLTAVEVFLRV